MVVIWMLCFIMVMDGLAVLARECVSERDELKRVHRSGPSDGTLFRESPSRLIPPAGLYGPRHQGVGAGAPRRDPVGNKHRQLKSPATTTSNEGEQACYGFHVPR